MPIYEYRCNQCSREFSELFLNPKEIKKVRCKYCHSPNLTRLVSSFSVHQTEESRLSQFDTSKPRGDEFYKDSRNVGLWAKKGWTNWVWIWDLRWTKLLKKVEQEKSSTNTINKILCKSLTLEEARIEPRGLESWTRVPRDDHRYKP